MNVVLDQPLWVAAAIAEAVGGTQSADFAINGVAFDSREVGEGDLFVALKGEETDGHKFVDGAFDRGAAGCIVSTPVDHPHILVDDTAAALNAFGRRSRDRSQAKIIGVTGSAGKTGTKEALFEALDRSSRGKAHRSLKSYNNHVGVPLSLARMPEDTKFGIFEMGMNHAGELSALTQLVRPDVAIVTTIAPAHVEFFRDEEAIAEAKAEIFEGLAPGGTALVPYDSPHHALLRERAERFADKVISFGLGEGADARALDYVDATGGGSLVTAKIGGKFLCYTVAMPGRHWVANSLAVMAAVDAVGGDLAIAGLALADIRGLEGRGAKHRIEIDGGEIQLIDESYNANPASMAATIEGFGRSAEGRKVAVLGSMLELGERSPAYHAALADDLAAAKVDYTLLVGEEMKALAERLGKGVESAPAFAHCGDVAEAQLALESEMRPGDSILIKGSNGVGLSKIVKRLTGGKGD